MLITNVQADELLSKLSDLSGLDQELIERCSLLIRSERYDEAVSRAFVVLEERLRELLAVSGGSGVDLSQKAFSPNKGQLVSRLYLPPAEAEGIRDLFVGAFRAYRNRAAHTVAGYTLVEARAIIHLVNLLLLTLQKVSDVSTQHIPPKITHVLGLSATKRLDSFLNSLPDIGLNKGKGKGSIPYWATFEYDYPSWEKPRPYQVSVLYLGSSAGKPMLMFHSAGLSRVVGLDIGQLEAELLQAGCIRVVAKTTPIRLPLAEHNDQATFDRLYTILQGLMERHR